MIEAMLLLGFIAVIIFAVIYAKKSGEGKISPHDKAEIDRLLAKLPDPKMAKEIVHKEEIARILAEVERLPDPESFKYEKPTEKELAEIKAYLATLPEPKDIGKASLGR